MNKSSFGPLSSHLKVILSVFWYFGLLLSPMLVVTVAVSIFRYRSILNIVFSIYFLVAVGCILMILYESRKILETVISKEPFVLANVNRFRKIGYLTLVLGVFLALYSILQKGTSIFTILDLGGSGIHTNIGIFVPFILGIFSFVIAEIFKVAHDIYEENKLTI